MEQTHIITVKFKTSNKCYYFLTTDETVKPQDFILADTAVGLEIAQVVETDVKVSESFNLEIKPIVRKAEKNDLVIYEKLLKLSEEAKVIFEKYSNQLKLNMKLIDAFYTFDKQKILFIYSSDEHVDFRELLKYLAHDLKCRIELKQINSRERAQSVGGLGVCGLPLCCTTFFKTFEGISVNRAKNQMLAINIPKLSGQCNKLMCCLKYEDDLYTEAKANFPNIGTRFTFENTEYKVSSYNILTKIIKIDSQDNTQYITLDQYNKVAKKNYGKKSKTR